MPNFKMMRANRDAWAAAQTELPDNLPASTVWERADDALRVLAPLVSSGVSRVLLPGMGVIFPCDLRRSREPGCLELVPEGRVAYVLKPARVALELFPQAPLESFALIELADLHPTGVYEAVSRQSEEVTEADGEYHERWCWDEATLGNDRDGDAIPLPRDARLVVRWLRGRMMVVARGSIWGHATRAHGLHERHNASEIREQIERVLTKLGPDYLDRAPAV